MIARAFWIDRDAEPFAKYAPGDVIADDHPRREWLLKSGIAEPKKVEEIDDEPTEVEVEEIDDEPTEVEDPVAKSAAAKPKPTDSIDAHREYLKNQGIETKGLSRAQMVKIIAGTEE